MKRRDKYLDAYALHTDSRVLQDPHQAVGGRWEEMGRLQLDFLLKQGMRPEHRMLDIGCGTLRGGRHFIRYLLPGQYTGFDISVQAIEYARQLVRDEALSDKQPRILLSVNKDLQFREFVGERFEIVFAQSVFTHLKPEHIEECFAHVGAIMSDASRFFFTFNDAPSFVQTGRKGFRYPLAFFQSLSARSGFILTDLSGSYPHPNGQRMLMVSR